MLRQLHLARPVVRSSFVHLVVAAYLHTVLLFLLSVQAAYESALANSAFCEASNGLPNDVVARVSAIDSTQEAVAAVREAADASQQWRGARKAALHGKTYNARVLQQHGRDSAAGGAHPAGGGERSGRRRSSSRSRGAPRMETRAGSSEAQVMYGISCTVCAGVFAC